MGENDDISRVKKLFDTLELEILGKLFDIISTHERDVAEQAFLMLANILVTIISEERSLQPFVTIEHFAELTRSIMVKNIITKSLKEHNG